MSFLSDEYAILTCFREIKGLKLKSDYHLIFEKIIFGGLIIGKNLVLGIRGLMIFGGLYFRRLYSGFYGISF